MTETIRPFENYTTTDFPGSYTSCIILTKNNQLLLQKRGENWPYFPDFISCFGGKVEINENPAQALTRELKEELGVDASTKELIFLAAYKEKATHYQDRVFGFFWHDINDQIKHCFEGEAVFFDSIAQITNQPKVMDDIVWLLDICRKKGFITLS